MQTMTATFAAPVHQPTSPLSPAVAPCEASEATNSDEQWWSLGAVEWETYRAIADALIGRHVRLTYERGRFEFTSWRYNGTQLTVNQLQADGNYNETESSRYFPNIRIAELLRFIEQRTRTDENSLVKSFRDWVRQQIAK